MRNTRPATAYSLQQYGFSTRNGPHSSLEKQKFSNQTVVFSVSPKRRELIKCTSLKNKKEIIEWIESDRPNGIEILTKIANNTKSPYKHLISRALKDLKIVEKRANLITENDLHEKLQNEEETLNQTDYYQRLLDKTQKENEILRKQLESSKKMLCSLNDDYKRRQDLMKSVKSKLDSDEYDDTFENTTDQCEKRKKFKDDKSAPIDTRITMYKMEEDRLEDLLFKLETRLFALTREQRAMLVGEYLNE
ncbi:hypothetical protein TRFO_31969 [Tritrichomonas foetus]|uniref:Uncharacterized protein n=1 Tax=Tritrichomonas foetus TaxID=1144522 RepID=A0A1J4JQD3_9EUKA|nr:hypothetical protein TRFO_31969 [Tritrichomonas foetus]|eukprot:OHT01259.1 hypothetical protein TRFO_31969 [Tritrichomonas foetus]